MAPSHRWRCAKFADPLQLGEEAGRCLKPCQRSWPAELAHVTGYFQKIVNRQDMEALRPGFHLIANRRGRFQQRLEAWRLATGREVLSERFETRVAAQWIPERV